MLNLLPSRYRLFLPAGAITAALLWLACASSTKDPVGFDPPDEPIHKKTLRPGDVDWRDTYYDVFVPTGRHFRLAVGAWGGFRSRMLLRYELADIPKEIKLNRITAVNLRFAYMRVSGDLNDDVFSYGDVDIEVHALRRYFDEDGATWWRSRRDVAWGTPGGDFGPALSHVVIGDPTFQRELFYADVTDLALDWMANPSRNHGILLKAAIENETTGIKDFYATNSLTPANAPALEIIYVDDDGIKQNRFVVPQKDCFVTDYDGKFAGNSVHGRDAYVDFGSFNGYGRRGLVYFNLLPAVSGIPQESSIVRARLRLYYVPSGRDERVMVGVFRVNGPFTERMTEAELELVRFHDNIPYTAVEFKKKSPGYVDFYINNLVAEWVAGNHANYGLVIKAPDEGEAQVLPRFGSQENADPDRRPYLEIEYTLPQEPWYGSP